MSATFENLLRQNVTVDCFLEAVTTRQCSAHDLSVLLTNASSVDLSYRAKIAKAYIAKDGDLGADDKELLLEIISSAMLLEGQVFTWVEYGGTRVRVLNPYGGDNKVIGHAQLGLTLWEAEICTLEWLEIHPEFVKGRSILELGAGVGLAGIAAVERLGAKAVTLTDSDDMVLENLAEIIAKSPKRAHLKVQCLEWRDSAQVANTEQHDLVIAADCIYDPNDVPIFVKALSYLFEGSKDKQGILAYSIRNKSTFDLLMAALKEAGFKLEPTFLTEQSEKYCTRTSHMFTKSWSRSNVALFLLRR